VGGNTQVIGWNADEFEDLESFDGEVSVLESRYEIGSPSLGDAGRERLDDMVKDNNKELVAN
jgi:hypothetical protein